MPMHGRRLEQVPTTLPVCNTQLATSRTQLTTCKAQLNATAVAKKACTTKLTACTQSATAKQLSACQRRGAGYSGAAASATTKLQRCNAAKDALAKENRCGALPALFCTHPDGLRNRHACRLRPCPGAWDGWCMLGEGGCTLCSIPAVLSCPVPPPPPRSQEAQGGSHHACQAHRCRCCRIGSRGGPSRSMPAAGGCAASPGGRSQLLADWRPGGAERHADGARQRECRAGATGC